MGDRANVVVHQNSYGEDFPPVYLYTHSGGSFLLSDVQEALRRKLRWSDHSYLTRIIFDQMTKGHQGSETGHGISTSPPDNEHDLIHVNVGQQEVTVGGYTWSFVEFVEATNIDDIEY